MNITAAYNQVIINDRRVRQCQWLPSFALRQNAMGHAKLFDGDREVLAYAPSVADILGEWEIIETVALSCAEHNWSGLISIKELKQVIATQPTLQVLFNPLLKEIERKQKANGPA